MLCVFSTNLLKLRKFYMYSSCSDFERGNSGISGWRKGAGFKFVARQVQVDPHTVLKMATPCSSTTVVVVPMCSRL